MSTINRHLFTARENAQAAKKKSNAFALYIVCGVIVATASHLAAFAIGDRIGYERAKAQSVKPAPIVLQPAQLIQCDRHGLIELQRICRGRARMTEVGK